MQNFIQLKSGSFKTPFEGENACVMQVVLSGKQILHFISD